MADPATEAMVPLLSVAVVGHSMRPTLREGDRLLARRIDDATALRPGDVVVVRRPDRPDLVLVKRIVRREDDGWWVQGDNEGRSDDSRTFGAVPDAGVLARVVLRWWPHPRRVR
jgi:nickel-type superoxide dismutase maturation protease